VPDGNIKKILIMKASALGDIVRTFPSVVFLREKFPQAHIAYMVGEPYVELLEPCPHIDEIIPYKKRRNTEDIGGFIRFTRDIRRRRFDLALNLQNTNRFDFIARISGAKLRSRIIELDHPMDGVEGVFEILRTVGLEPGEAKYEFWLSDEDRAFAENFLRENGLSGHRPLLGLNPGVAWPSKLWPLEHFASLADRAQTELGARCVVFGNAAEAVRADKIASLMKTAAPVSAAGKTTIRQAAAIISRCNAFVSNDTGLMHIAAMQRVPTAAVFGPTSPDMHRPSGPGHKWHYLALPCAPCYKFDCPNGMLDCMNKISPDDVFESISALLRQNPAE